MVLGFLPSPQPTALEDDELVAVLMGDWDVETEKMKALVGKIRAFAVVEN